MIMDKSKQRLPLSEYARMANQSQPMQIAGKPADVCPYCGCGLFANGTRTGKTVIRRYVECRNPSCGKSFVSYQPPAVLAREVGEDD